MRVNQTTRSQLHRVVRSALDRGGVFGPPRTDLILYAKNSADSIGLSVDDYDNIGATWQAIFFTDSDTPIVFDDFDALWTAVDAESTLNEDEVMGTEAKGVAVYDKTTSRTILNKALRFFGLPQVYTYWMEDSELWPEDTDLWSED